MPAPEHTVTLHVEANIWQLVEEVVPFAREYPRQALAYLLGIAVGVLLEQQGADDELAERPTQT